jgi:hypothetical protein
LGCDAAMINIVKEGGIMARRVAWRRGRSEEVFWTTSTNGWGNNIDFTLVLEAARFNSLVNKHAKLIVKKKSSVDDKLEVILEKEFSSSWRAKDVVDAFLTLTCSLFNDKQEAEDFFINTLRNYEIACRPTQWEPDYYLKQHDRGKGYYS